MGYVREKIRAAKATKNPSKRLESRVEAAIDIGSRVMSFGLDADKGDLRHALAECLDALRLVQGT